jgi:hypothetical protein
MESKGQFPHSQKPANWPHLVSDYNPTDHNHFYPEDRGRMFMRSTGPHVPENKVP